MTSVWLLVVAMAGQSPRPVVIAEFPTAASCNVAAAKLVADLERKTNYTAASCIEVPRPRQS